MQKKRTQEQLKRNKLKRTKRNQIANVETKAGSQGSGPCPRPPRRRPAALTQTGLAIIITIIYCISY